MEKSRISWLKIYNLCRVLVFTEDFVFLKIETLEKSYHKSKLFIQTPHKNIPFELVYVQFAVCLKNKRRFSIF